MYFKYYRLLLKPQEKLVNKNRELHIYTVQNTAIATYHYHYNPCYIKMHVNLDQPRACGRLVPLEGLVPLGGLFPQGGLV